MKMFSRSDRYSLRITVIYLVISAAWIVFSDRLVSYLLQDTEFFVKVQTYKGLFFVLVTALLLYFLIRESTSTLVRSRERLENTLREKQILLSELHHRVKNNLAIIAGLIELQSTKLENENKDILKKTQYRIYSLANIQELLFREENLSQVPFHEHLQHLCSTINSAASTNLLDVEMDQIVVNINQAIPLSLLLNEFFSQIRLNTLQSLGFHASFTLNHHDDGTVRINIRLQNIPSNVIEHLRDTNKHLEATLINIYTKQLRGTSDWHHQDGMATFELRFKKSERPGSAASMNLSTAS